MTYKQLERMVYDLMGVTTPPWPLRVRTKSLLNQVYMRTIAENRLNAGRASLAFTAGDPMVTLPAGVLEVRTIRAGGTVLRMASDVEMARHEAGDVTFGVVGDGPQVWTLVAPDRIMVWPAPTVTDPAGAELLYTLVVPKMSAETDVPSALPEPWHDLLAWMVVSQLASDPQDRAQAQVTVQDMRTGLAEHVADRGGDDTFRIKLVGYPGRS